MRSPARIWCNSPPLGSQCAAPLASGVTAHLSLSAPKDVASPRAIRRSDGSRPRAGLIQRLRSALLAEKHELLLSDVANDLEEALANRRSILAEAEAKPNSSAESIISYLLDELAKIQSGSKDPDRRTLDGGGDHEPPTEAALNSALQGVLSASFRKIKEELPTIDISTQNGQHDALSLGFEGECIIAIRVLLAGTVKGDPLADRHPTLGALSDLRQHRRAYFDLALRCSAGLDNGEPYSRMNRYQFSTATAEGTPADSDLFTALLKLDLTAADWIKAPHGLAGWQAAFNGGSAVVHDERDYFCQPTLITDQCVFLHTLLKSIGLAHESTEGYTMITAGEYYNSHLLNAKRLSTEGEVFFWLERASTQWQIVLRLISERLQSIVYSRTLSCSLKTYVLGYDNEAFGPLKNADRLLNRIADARAEMREMTGETSASSGTVNAYQLPKLSAKPKSLGGPTPKKAGKAPKRKTPGSDVDPSPGGGPSPDGGLQPGSLLQSFKWSADGKVLLISGFVWQIVMLAAFLKVSASGPNAPCWPYLLARCADKNRRARCNCWGQGAHANDTSPAHRIHGKPIMSDQAGETRLLELAAKFAKVATAEQKKGLVTMRSPGTGTPGKGKGRGTATSRGRGRGGAALFDEEPDFH